MLSNPKVKFFRRLFPKRLQRLLFLWIHTIFFILVCPANLCLAFTRKKIFNPGTILHISYLVHIPYNTVQILRRNGAKADYLAVDGESDLWDKSDYFFYHPAMPWQEFLFFWRVVARYEIIHTHFGVTLSHTRWELPILKRMGRKIVINYRGCEARDREKNISLHPEMNICEDCDYHGSKCREGKKIVNLYKKHADITLVTTPDMRDFLPEAIHFPFFAPEGDVKPDPVIGNKKKGDFKIVHITSHPGIEGTNLIKQAVENLIIKGYQIHFVFLRNVTNQDYFNELNDADLTIGKLKMGYYANAQIESLYCGIPAITYVRPEFMTAELAESGLIFSSLPDLERTIQYYIDNPKELEKKRKIAQSSILRIHNNDELARQLINIYDNLLQK